MKPMYAAVGNPPYQDETVGKNKSFSKPLYHEFMLSTYAIAQRACLVHPARFLFNAGATPKAFNEQMLNDKHFSVVKYFENG